MQEWSLAWLSTQMYKYEPVAICSNKKRRYCQYSKHLDHQRVARLDCTLRRIQKLEIVGKTFSRDSPGNEELSEDHFVLFVLLRHLFLCYMFECLPACKYVYCESGPLWTRRRFHIPGTGDCRQLQVTTVWVLGPEPLSSGIAASALRQ